MDIMLELNRENAEVRARLALVEQEVEGIRRRRATTARDIKAGWSIVGSQEASFTGNKLRADYLLLSSDELRLKWAEMMRKRPYFCRIDWHEDGQELETYYIGRVGMCRSDDYTPIVVDWRAPISNLYYDGRLGHAQYEAPDGTFTGDLQLKRQLEIEDGIVKNLTDIDITTNDNLLQAALSKSADDRLKDIVVTIQAEQNRIIRDKPEGVLIVQGVAGSGKTTIVLHRVAYLIYHSEGGKGLKTLIIAPNRLFLNYISNVLPELGVEDIQQDTFSGIISRFLPAKTKVESSFEPTDVDELVSQYKGSMAFKELIDAYVAYLEDCMVPDIDFSLDGQVVLKYDEIKRIVRRDCQYLPLGRRHKEIEKRLTKRTRHIADKIVEWKLADSENKLIQLRHEGELTSQTAHAIYDERDRFVAQVEGEVKSAVKGYMKLWMADSTLNLYYRLISDENLMKMLEPCPNSSTQRLLSHISQHTATNLMPTGKITQDDIAGLAYLESLVAGGCDVESYDLVVVDEGQDISEFQYFMLRRVARSMSFTIAGDLNQAIYARGLNRWERLEATVFPDLPVRYQTITKSYRTTVEIMRFANRIISLLGTDAALADPVLRHGPEPMLFEHDSAQSTVDSIAKALPQYLNEGFVSIGVICRNTKAAKECHKRLSSKVNADLKEKLHLLGDAETQYMAGVSVMPVQLAKGLEFDVTIVSDAHSYTTSPKDIRLFYVAVTRALHRLAVHSAGPAEILSEVCDESYLLRR